MSNRPQADISQIKDFLEQARPDGQFVLAAIPVEGGTPRVETFELASKAADWAAKMNADTAHNLYWIPNRLHGPTKKKPLETDVEAVLYLYVDVDPRPPQRTPDTTTADVAEWNRGERERILSSLQAHGPAPSIIVDSGGGYQAFWLLDEPLHVGGDAGAIGDIKPYNVELRDKLGGDNCQSLDHLMRLPGTVNWPNKSKQERGRTPRLASVVEFSSEKYPLGHFRSADETTDHRNSNRRPKPKTEVTIRGEVGRLNSLDELPQGVSSRIRDVILKGREADPERYPSRSEAVCGVTRSMVRAGCADQTIVAVLIDPRFGISESILEHGARSQAEAVRQIAKARDHVGNELPRIIWSETQLHRCLDEAEAAMLKSGIAIYSMGDRLVQPVRLDSPQNEGDQICHDTGSLVIASVSKHRLREFILASAQFVKLERKADGELVEKPYAPTVSFAEHYLARIGAWRLPVLAGVATTPTMRLDGSIVAAEGYDPLSRLIVDMQGISFPTVPEAPTGDEACAALDVLVDLISEFPFVSDEEDGSPSGELPSKSRSVALAMILTGVARPALRAAPMFGISAPTMATGKSLLADVVALIVTGRNATKMSQGANEEEDEKRLLSVLMQGSPIVVIDNIARPVSGDSLCTILTDEKWQGRMLGRSEMREVHTKALFVATGNNLAFREDMSSRAVLVSLDAEVEDPGGRRFRRDLRSYVPEHRAELATAALTVLRGYIAADCPRIEGMHPTRFTDWDLVRAALMWLGEPDPWATNARVASGDNARSDHIALMSAIGEALGFGVLLSTTQIIERTNWNPLDDVGRQLDLALSAALPHGVSAVGLGRYFRKFEGRRVGGMWIKAIPNDKRGGRYAIMLAQKPEPTSLRGSRQHEFALDGGAGVEPSAEKRRG